LKKSHRKKVILGALVLAGAGGGAAALWPRSKPVSVVIARLETVPELRSIVHGTGEVRTQDKADIQSELAGVIVELPVREGDHVVKDQVLLRIDPFQSQSEVEAARSALLALEAEAQGQAFQIATSEANTARDEFLKKSAEADLLQAETNLARTKEVYQREKSLLDANLISKDQFEITETQRKLNESQVVAAGSRIQQLDAQINATRSSIEFARAVRDAVAKRVEGAQSSLRRTEDMLHKTILRAPFDGVIVKLNVKKGERAVPGVLSSPQATLMTIADFSVLETELKVDETDIVSVKLGDRGKIVVDALLDQSLEGTVVEIGNSPIASLSGGGGGGMGSGGGQEGKDFKVVLRIENPPAALRPGMSCEADITTSTKTNVAVLPIQALTMREVLLDAQGKYIPEPMDEKSSPRNGVASADGKERNRKEIQGVFVAAADGKARFRPVETGILGEMDIELVGGLEGIDEVIVGPLKALRSLEEGAHITVDRSKPFRRRPQKGPGSEEGAP